MKLIQFIMCCCINFIIQYQVAYSMPEQSKEKVASASIDLIQDNDMQSFQSFNYKKKKMSPLYDKPNNSDLSQFIPVFNQWFNTNVQTLDELTITAAQLISNFYNKLRQCLPGTYRYLQPNILFGLKIKDNWQPKYFFTTSIIYGPRAERCEVETIIQKIHTSQRFLCYYSPTSLSFYSDQKAKADAINYQRYTRDDLDKLQQILNECKPLLGNAPLT